MLVNVLGKMGMFGLKVQKYIPEIAMGFGAACVVTGTIECCKATLKVEDILDDTKKKVDQIHEDAEFSKVSNKEVQKRLYKAYLNSGWRMFRNYAKGGGMVALGLASGFYGYGVLNGRYVGTIFALKGLESKFDTLEKGVIDKYGKDVRDELLYGVTRDDVEYDEVDEEGNAKTRKVKKARIIPEDYSPYAIIFDSANPNWEKNAAYNLMWLRGIENYCNDLLRSRGHVFLNDVLDALGFKRTPDGAIRGWIYDDDEYISFGIDWEDGEKHPAVRRFLNGWEPNVILDFNLGINSIIWDRI